MSRKKKGLALWLALFLGVSSLTGCGSGNDNMTQLSQKGADIMSSSDEEQDTDVEPLKQRRSFRRWDYHPGADGDHCGKR